MLISEKEAKKKGGGEEKREVRELLRPFLSFLFPFSSSLFLFSFLLRPFIIKNLKK